MNILAVSCHPDDIEIGAGGTIAKYAARGDRVTICHAANGDMGHVVILPDELRKIRLAEARAGGEALGAVEVVTLDAGDLTVDSRDPDTVRRLVEIVRRVNPDAIITHDPEDYMKDHAEVSKLAFDASFTATIPHYETESPHIARFAPIFYMDTLAGVNFQPEHYVDVTAEIERKLFALARHESQVKWMLDHDRIDFLDMVRTCARYRGYQCGVPYAEGFRSLKAYPRLSAKQLLPLDDC